MKSPLMVFEVRDAGDGNYSTPAVDVLNDTGVEAPEILAAPVMVGFVGVLLTWEAVVGATGYRIEKQSGTSWVLVANVGSGTLTQGELNDVGQFYRVRALNAAGASNPSNKATYTP